jgi:hypothetical protein
MRLAQVLGYKRQSRVFEAGSEVEERLLTESMDAVDSYVRNNSGERFPRSLSLLQTVVGVLARQGVVGTTLRGYHPMITEQLRTLFPEVVTIKGAFDFEMMGT